MESRGEVKAKRLEDYEPGVTKDDIFQVLAKVATQKTGSKRRTKKSAPPPEPSSSET